MFRTVQLCKRAKEVVKPGGEARYDGPGRKVQSPPKFATA